MSKKYKDYSDEEFEKMGFITREEFDKKHSINNEECKLYQTYVNPSEGIAFAQEVDRKSKNIGKPKLYQI
jgi:hypothetical protein